MMDEYEKIIVAKWLDICHLRKKLMQDIAAFQDQYGYLAYEIMKMQIETAIYQAKTQYFQKKKSEGVFVTASQIDKVIDPQFESSYDYLDQYLQYISGIKENIKIARRNEDQDVESLFRDILAAIYDLEDIDLYQKEIRDAFQAYVLNFSDQLADLLSQLRQAPHIAQSADRETFEGQKIAADQLYEEVQAQYEKFSQEYDIEQNRQLYVETLKQKDADLKEARDSYQKLAIPEDA